MQLNHPGDANNRRIPGIKELYIFSLVSQKKMLFLQLK